jgi:hypothetical protein
MVNELWNYMYPTQIRAMAQEPDAEILGVELESFKDVCGGFFFFYI